jgi:hypothetical protein
MVGRDVDLGFLVAKKGIDVQPRFHRQFDPKMNWWLIKKLFKNPITCVQVIFLDRRHIHSLQRFARFDPDWEAYRHYIRHMPGHQNHLHVRIGDWPGEAGCIPAPYFERRFAEGSGERRSSHL